MRLRFEPRQRQRGDTRRRLAIAERKAGSRHRGERGAVGDQTGGREANHTALLNNEKDCPTFPLFR